MFLKGIKESYIQIEPTKKKKTGNHIKTQGTDSKKTFIAKRIPPANPLQDQIHQSQFIKISHPNISPTTEFIKYKNDTYIIREFIEGTDLKTIIRKKQTTVGTNQALMLKSFICLLDALASLHEHNFIHQNIKPSNILFCHPPKEKICRWIPQNIMLLDFEQTKPHNLNKKKTSAPFSMIYSPPEQLLNHGHLCNPTSDMFSLAISLYETISGKQPLYDCNAEVLINLQLTYPLNQPPKMTTDLFNIIKKSAHKGIFPKPPRMLSSEQIESILLQGISGRYNSIQQVKEDLIKYLNEKHPTSKKKYINFLFPSKNK